MPYNPTTRALRLAEENVRPGDILTLDMIRWLIQRRPFMRSPDPDFSNESYINYLRIQLEEGNEANFPVDCIVVDCQKPSEGDKVNLVTLWPCAKGTPNSRIWLGEPCLEGEMFTLKREWVRRDLICIRLRSVGELHFASDDLYVVHNGHKIEVHSRLRQRIVATMNRLEGVSRDTVEYMATAFTLSPYIVKMLFDFPLPSPDNQHEHYAKWHLAVQKVRNLFDA